MRKIILLISLALIFSATSKAEEFSLEFDWSDLERCTSGRPNTVTNPTFTLNNVPQGTTWIYFKLTDLDVRSYNHGGGWVEFTGQSTIEPGVFKYKSPCPPNGKHEYEWTATAKSKKSAFGNTIQSAKSSQMYP
jgi:phosphatidylethanolamine-binding protein (PEBP) family uncharacterized protein